MSAEATTDRELAAEQAHLDRTWSAYDHVLRALSGERGAGIDEFANEALERMRRERLRLYTASSGPLFFGRIDEAAGERRYIGRHAIADEDNELLVVNWRAPAAEPFYAATTADHRGLLGRRRLDVDDRRVLGFVDETLAAADGSRVLDAAIVEDITRRRVGEMRQIVSTITPDQYELIARDVEGALVIQGGPGTGKTAVGLHRAAWLLYADPALARAGVLVVGPNEVFIAYISQVLPSLGETTVEQKPVDALAPARGARAAEPTDVATLKGSGRMAPLLERLLWARVAPVAETVRIRNGRDLVVIAPADVAPLVAATREQTRSYEAGRERFRARMADWVMTRAHDGTAIRRTKEFQKLVTAVWPRVTADQLFLMALKGRPRLADAARGLLDDDEVDLLLSSGPPKPKGALRHSDVPLLDEARWLVDPDLRTYGHVVVDEAQNLTPMELRMAARRARGHAMTILGDIAQRTADAELESWSAVVGAAGVRRFDVAQLEVSYRVPDDFLRLAATVAPAGIETQPRGVREAPWAALAIAAADGADLARSVQAIAAALRDRVGSVGVVAAADHHAPLVAAAGLSETTDHLTGGVDLLGLQAVKGLEFDAVVVVEPAAILAERPDGGGGGLYTALTRSTRALAIVHQAPLPAALAGAPELRHVGLDAAVATFDA
ncbi:DNA helicase IV [Baekduia alba]|uniref:HelD family protein n=1 Tax=Baekduia alba TaxID=2997333 RepID=UPI00234064B6|nr:AAA family ATPase [Baekduia alba]WCB95054.1 DNA helicase IV [Baekduia alba]